MKNQNQPLEPGPGRSTSDEAFGQRLREIAQQNDVAQKAARERRTIRDNAAQARRVAWERESGFNRI